MPKRTFPLGPKSAFAQAKADGTASASIGPTLYGESWSVSNVMVQNTTPNTSTNSPQAVMNINGVPVAGTYSGVQDNTDVTAELWQGHTIRVDWTGCDPGTLCTLTVYGQKTVTGG